MADPIEVVHELYAGFFESGIRYFFPAVRIEILERLPEAKPVLSFHHRTDGAVELEWMDRRYHLELAECPFTENGVRLLAAIGGVLSARYRGIFFSVSAANTFALFEGLAEDRFVSAFLDPTEYLNENSVPAGRDVIADAIEVLRETSLITYENRRVSTGVLLLGAKDGGPKARPGSISYTKDLVSIKSFHRLCDGLNTVFLVNRGGMLLDLVDIADWSEDHNGTPLPAPSPARYDAHSRATLHGGAFCLVLTPNGEIKVFAEGTQLFSFMEGRWRVTDGAEKYHEWRRSVGNPALAERLFTSALNLAEHRRGGLFVVLDEPEGAASLVAPGDLLDHEAEGAKSRIHYLLRGKRVLELEPSVLESIARMDGGIVLDRESNLLAFGAILRARGVLDESGAMEGGRTTAAVQASAYGKVLKISEDGIVSFYSGGKEVWEI